jgi:hypothetical protein
MKQGRVDDTDWHRADGLSEDTMPSYKNCEAYFFMMALIP